ncbi:replicative DNA helicase [Clostridium aminobutyricum]|uniref:Replicative DNA helicase n=1 Tax=Clostridium aminobutyricum TaxID=33953 RepID=A0A939IJ97_CLOAM|nr:replicative DNA helicase [Clostridium aminobutyricum]MBN7773383.1 replicative DNA helicase [Clostridium aminobutyricum]
MIERIPPHNDDAEKSVMGAAMISKDALFDVIETVRPEDFYSEIHKEIFQAIVDLCRKNTPVDALTVAEELKRRKSLEMVGGRAYILSLAGGVPTTANAQQYAKIVAEKAVLRNLIKTAADISEKSFQEKMESSEVLDFAERGIFEIAQKRQGKDYSSLKDVLLENIDRIDEISKMDGNVTGVPTGFMDLDAKTSGFQRSELIILAARPAMGKTAFALNVAQQAAIKGNATVMIFSLEMSKDQLGQRLLSMESRIEMQKLKTGQLERNDWENISLAMDTLAKANIYIDDTPGISIMEMKNKCRRLAAEKGLDMVVVDYLQLMNIEGRSESRQQEISTLSRSLKLLAREMDCPVILLSQLSRAPEQRTDHRPILSDLRESGSIEQDADIVIFLYRDDYYNPESDKPGVCEVIISKQRSGPTGTVELTWLGKYTRFVDKSNMR